MKSSAFSTHFVGYAAASRIAKSVTCYVWEEMTKRNIEIMGVYDQAHYKMKSERYEPLLLMEAYDPSEV